MSFQYLRLSLLVTPPRRCASLIAPLLLTALSACASGEPDSGDPDGVCETDSLGSSVDAIVQAGTDLEERLLAACVAIANLRAEPPLNEADTDTSVSCDAANDVLQAEIAEGARIADDAGACWLSIPEQEACEQNCTPACEPEGERCESGARKDDACSTNLSESGCAATCSAGCGAITASTATCDSMTVVVDADHAPNVRNVLAEHLPTVRQVRAHSELLRAHLERVFGMLEHAIVRPCMTVNYGDGFVAAAESFVAFAVDVDKPSHLLHW